MHQVKFVQDSLYWSILEYFDPHDNWFQSMVFGFMVFVYFYGLGRTGNISLWVPHELQ